VSERIIGFDPGLETTGYAVLAAGSRPAIVEAGVIRTPQHRPLAERLQTLYREATLVFAQHRPTAAAIEQLYSHYDRPTTAILMGHARGVLLLAAADAGLAVASYLPTEVKKTTTGSGRASKTQMQLAIQRELGLATPPSPADVADAIAVALCHLYTARQRQLEAG
jgi:crossover junction endodeoxyribonuclease RuvC